MEWINGRLEDWQDASGGFGVGKFALLIIAVLMVFARSIF
jgi:hypothetical protein